MVTDPVDPARPVQYGFIVTGPNVWPGDEPLKGSITIGTGPVPVESTTWGSVKKLYQ